MCRSGTALAAFMGIAGVTHFVAPAYYRRLVPGWVPAAPAVVVASGLLDLGTAVLLAVPTTREVGGWATAALIVAYLPVHLDAARRARRTRGGYAGPVGAAARILVNLGYIAWALSVARGGVSKRCRCAGRVRTRRGGGEQPRSHGHAGHQAVAGALALLGQPLRGAPPQGRSFRYPGVVARVCHAARSGGMAAGAVRHPCQRR